MNGNNDPWIFPAGTLAVVTGGTKHIGASIVDELSRKGATIFTCSRNEKELAYKIGEWKSKGYNVEGVAVDLTTAGGRFTFTDAIRHWLRGKPLDILVNNVGYHPQTVGNSKTSLRESEKIWESNFHSMYMLTSICRDHLKRSPFSSRNSCVVNIASVDGFISQDPTSPYPAAKAAVIKATGDWAT